MGSFLRRLAKNAGETVRLRKLGSFFQNQDYQVSSRANGFVLRHSREAATHRLSALIGGRFVS
jgi:hypothetical protein